MNSCEILCIGICLSNIVLDTYFAKCLLKCTDFTPVMRLGLILIFKKQLKQRKREIGHTNV